MKLSLTISVVLFSVVAGLSPVAAQGCGDHNPNCVVPTAPPGTSNQQSASTQFVEQAIAALPSAALDNLCATNNDFLIRLSGNWQCGGFGAGLSLSGAVLSATGGGLGIINVQSAPYSAKCDQVTDDTAAIQAAINAAGGVNVSPPKASSILLISGRCLITGALTAYSRSGFPGGGPSPNFIIACSGGGAGLLWGGTNNTGPMLQLGNGSGVDEGFEVRGCSFGGPSSGGVKPSIAIEIESNNSSIHDNNFGWVYHGVQCAGASSCQLTGVIRNIFSGCFDTCVYLPTFNAGMWIEQNEFSICGNYCIDDQYGDSPNIRANDFEGNVSSSFSDVGGSAGSINIGAGSAVDGFKIKDNRFEDANTAGGSGFRSITITNGIGLIEGNLLGANATYPGGPAYYYLLKTGGSATFMNEYISNSPGSGSSGKLVDAESGQVSSWFGGINCNPANIFGGTDVNFQVRSLLAPEVWGRGFTAQRGTSNSSPFNVALGGAITGSEFVSGGTTHNTYSGTCGATYNTGGASGGTFEVTPSSCSAQTVIMTFATAAPNGWACQASDLSTPADTAKQTASATTTATFLVTAAANDIVSFQCTGY